MLLAVSGGADSVALLRAVTALASQRTWHMAVHVGHIHHHLRPEADAEAAFVHALATQLGWPCFTRDVDLSPRSGNLENQARRLRYEALAGMAQGCGAARILTAHQADDQLETLLMRLMRGASIRGLSAMAWRRRLPPPPGMQSGEGGPDAPGLWLLRPMLGQTHAQAVAFLHAIGQPWCEDASNRDTTRLRAALRTHVLPALRATHPRVAEQAVRTAGHLRQVADWLEQSITQAATLFVTAEDGQACIAPRQALRDLPPVVLTGLLRKLMQVESQRTDRMGRRAMAPLLRAIRDTTGGHRQFMLAEHTWHVTREQVRLVKKI